MTPELLQKLKEAGFPQELKEGNMILLPDLCEQCNDYHHVYEPTLEELIEECIKISPIGFLIKRNFSGTWVVCTDLADPIAASSDHLKEALGMLYLIINKK